MILTYTVVRGTEYYSNNEDTFDLNDFLEGRANVEAYSVFVTQFVSVVVHRLKFKVDMRRADRDDEVFTPSDEALAFLLLENSWDAWEDVVQRTARQKNSKKKRTGTDFHCVKPTKYTGRNPSKEERNIRQGDRGWNRSGIERFNALLKQVKKDRKEHPAFFETYLQAYQSERDDKPRKRRGRMDPQAKLLLADNDLAMHDKKRKHSSVDGSGEDSDGSASLQG